MFIYFRKNQENFSELSTIRKRNGAEHRTKTSRSFTTKARPPREKRRSASGSARTPFRGGSFCLCVFFLFCPLGNGGLILPFERLRFGLFLGVSLSAAARSAAALVYDKLTPNCRPILESYMKIGRHHYGGCLYGCIEFNKISKRTVQRIVPLPIISETLLP